MGGEPLIGSGDRKLPMHEEDLPHDEGSFCAQKDASNGADEKRRFWAGIAAREDTNENDKEHDFERGLGTGQFKA